MTKTEDGDIDYTWKEWEMMNKDQESAIDIPGKIKFIIIFETQIVYMYCYSTKCLALWSYSVGVTVCNKKVLH